jgi:integrase
MSRRKIPLPDFTVSTLDIWKKTQMKNRDSFEDDYKETNLVCTWGDGRPYDPDYLTKQFPIFIRKINKSIPDDMPKLPVIRFHDLRHSHATMMLKEGINAKVISERLGHSNINITLGTYSHVMPDMQKEAAEKINIVLFKKGEEPKKTEEV